MLFTPPIEKVGSTMSVYLLVPLMVVLLLLPATSAIATALISKQRTLLKVALATALSLIVTFVGLYFYSMHKPASWSDDNTLIGLTYLSAMTINFVLLALVLMPVNTENNLPRGFCVSTKSIEELAPPPPKRFSPSVAKRKRTIGFGDN